MYSENVPESYDFKLECRFKLLTTLLIICSHRCCGIGKFAFKARSTEAHWTTDRNKSRIYWQSPSTSSRATDKHCVMGFNYRAALPNRRAHRFRKGNLLLTPAHKKYQIFVKSVKNYYFCKTVRQRGRRTSHFGEQT